MSATLSQIKAAYLVTDLRQREDEKVRLLGIKAGHQELLQLLTFRLSFSLKREENRLATSFFLFKGNEVARQEVWSKLSNLMRPKNVMNAVRADSQTHN